VSAQLGALDEGQRRRVERILGDARRHGFLGPGPLGPHLGHALAFGRVVRGVLAPDGEPLPAAGSRRPADLLDLGSGGGLPGLVLATVWRAGTITLLDAAARRAEFLEDAARWLELSNVVVLHGRAEVLGRMAAHRGAYGAVVARSFGPPAVTAECAAPFLSGGGILVVSDPPDGERAGRRWVPEGLSVLGMGQAVRYVEEYGFTVVRQESPCPERFPRRVGVPAKRPLF
jgi:16S rRNA (guanine527-N7)-methyltransferase